MGLVTHVNESNFQSEVLDAQEPVLVDFYATWCPPCRMLAPVLEKLAGEFAGQAKLVKVDVDQSQRLAIDYRIQAMPTLLLFQNGQEVDRMVGAPPEVALRQGLQRVVSVG